MLELYVVIHACLYAIPDSCRTHYLRVDPEVNEVQCMMTAHSVVFTTWMRNNSKWKPITRTCSYVDMETVLRKA